jgi:hypothetical protein
VTKGLQTGSFFEGQIGAFWREVEVGCTTWLERMSANEKISSENNLRYIVTDLFFRLIIMMSFH